MGGWGAVQRGPSIRGSTEPTSTLIGKRRVLARVACRMNRMLLGSRSTQARASMDLTVCFSGDEKQGNVG